MDALETARACADWLMADDAATRSLGITVEIPAPGSAVATMRVREDMTNGHGICHGGLIFTLADTAFAFASNAYDEVTVAAGGAIEFLKPVAAGEVLRAVASEAYRGRRRGLYTVEVSNADGDLVALFRGRSAARGKTLLEPSTK